MKKELRKRLYSRANFEQNRQATYSSKNFSLSGIENLLATLGNPQDDFLAVHVAGTKGKGSVCRICSQALHGNSKSNPKKTINGQKKSRLQVGAYYSPHLFDESERFEINGVHPTWDLLNPIFERVLDMSEQLADKGVQTTIFDIFTATAFSLFSQSDVDIAFVETGLGGRLDSTNILMPILSVITRIDYDHLARLGNTIEQIAGEKAGIIKQKTPLIHLFQPQTSQVFEERCQELASCRFPVVIKPKDLESMSIYNHLKNEASPYWKKENLKLAFQVLDRLSNALSIASCFEEEQKTNSQELETFLDWVRGYRGGKNDRGKNYLNPSLHPSIRDKKVANWHNPMLRKILVQLFVSKDEKTLFDVQFATHLHDKKATHLHDKKATHLHDKKATHLHDKKMMKSEKKNRFIEKIGKLQKSIGNKRYEEKAMLSVSKKNPHLGRYHLVKNYLFDVAHLPSSMKQLLDVVKKDGRLQKYVERNRVFVIFFAYFDKDIEGMVKIMPRDWPLVYFDCDLFYISKEMREIVKKRVLEARSEVFKTSYSEEEESIEKDLESKQSLSNKKPSLSHKTDHSPLKKTLIKKNQSPVHYEGINTIEIRDLQELRSFESRMRTLPRLQNLYIFTGGFRVVEAGYRYLGLKEEKDEVR